MIAQEFRFPIAPTAKGRPRFTGGHAWTPNKTRMAEDGLKEALLSEGATCYGKGVPLAVVLTFGVEPPKAKKAAPTSRPDLDQYVKLVLDAGNGVLWADDAQIVRISAQKVFSVAPFTQIAVEEVETWT